MLNNVQLMRTDRRKQRYLRAKAFTEIDKYTEARQLLVGDRSTEADKIRIRLMWKENNWKRLITLLEPEMEGLQKLDSLDEVQTEKIIQLTIAYDKENMVEKRLNMAEIFDADDMPDEKSKTLFNYLTQEPSFLNYYDVSKSLELDKLYAFLDDYAFWPSKNWQATANLLYPIVMKNENAETLTQRQQEDIIRTAISLKQLEGDDAAVKLQNVLRAFRNVNVTDATIGVLSVFDGENIVKRDEPYAHKTPLNDLERLIAAYKASRSISELNLVAQ